MQAFAQENKEENTSADTSVEQSDASQEVENAEPTLSLNEKLEKARQKRIKQYSFNPVKNPEGQIILFEFNDLDCADCLEKSKKVFNTITSDNEKSLRIVYRHINHDSTKLVNNIEVYGMVANKYGKFWEFKEKLYQNSYKTEEQLINLLLSIGLTKKQINAGLTDDYKEIYYNLDADHSYAVSIESHSAPMFFIDGYRLDEDISLQELNEYIQLKKKEYLEKEEKENNKYKMGRF
tara:strand:+ start:213 stop:920 length:708 start_codon:yes stop_codon:yes gene_type:complete